MTARLPTSDRRRQAIAAALELLADTPIPNLSTRQIAKALGISQPALFRHFRSREALLLAVVDHCAKELEALATEAIGEAPDAPSQLEALARALLAFVVQHPGLPRLLFAQGAPGGDPVGQATADLVSRQRHLAAALIRLGQRSGAFDPAVSPAQAATLFVGMIQGLILQWEVEDRRGALAEDVGPLLGLWLDGVRGRGEPIERGAAPATEPTLAQLDVRPLLAGGKDPFDPLHSRIETLACGSLLQILAPFRPTPLLILLQANGHAVTARSHGRTWVVDLVIGGSPELVDLRDLEAPGPLEAVLEAAAHLSPGGTYLARVPRFPRLLAAAIAKRDLALEVLEDPEGSAVVLVRQSS